MDQKYFLIVLLASLRTTYLLKLDAYETLLHSQDPRQLCLPWFLGRPLCWGIIYTGKHNISIYTGKQYFHSEKYQRPCFRASPQSPQTAHEGGETPTPFPNLSLRVLKCSFRALSPCPIQILAGALLYDEYVYKVLA